MYFLLTVKELGILVNDPIIAKDTRRMFQQYWDVAKSNELPDVWSSRYDALMSKEDPIYRRFDEDDDISLFYTSSAPEPFCSAGRTYALDALVDLIGNAKEQVNVEVMDYVPASVYMSEKFYWDAIDRALRDANFRGVKVRFLAGKWNHTKSYTVQYLKSLDALDNVEVRWYTCPDMVGFEAIPYTRVNHAKFVGTDKGICSVLPLPRSFVHSLSFDCSPFFSELPFRYVQCTHIPLSLSHPFKLCFSLL